MDQYPGFAQQLEAHRGERGVDEQFAHLVSDAFRRHGSHEMRRCRHRPARSFGDGKPEARGELRRSEQPQRILNERRVSDDVDLSGDDIADSTEWIDDYVVAQTARDHIYSKIPATQVFLNRNFRPRFNRKITVSRARGPLPAGQRNISLSERMAKFDHGKGCTDDINAAACPQSGDQRFRSNSGYDVVQILRWLGSCIEPTAHLISNAATNSVHLARSEEFDENGI
jgi:hypothetical protein